ncbi:uncharacterized protein LOC123532728 [Mercenaria mercenaria]|uniref:uncharacterized protein LOC123532728 n=1 Tax=Mercenaria mercenaria TaxID=6596 RepID=UPI00234F6BE7|nr:uncharacterized protein LOC123532728 [Mercenaria mercenaria]XP_053373238.1 uncharacterized protein LOC123532728 [Mercenaria mercenaria]
MATTGTEKHFRLCLVLMKAGTKACHCLLLKRVKDLSPADHEPFPWTVDDFLLSKKKKIRNAKLGKEKDRILFPADSKTNLSKWDLSLFCFVLIECCKLPKLICLDVERLRTLRNELCHVHEPTVNDEVYTDYLTTITVIIRRIIDETDDECMKCEIKRIVNVTEKEPLSLEETLRDMHAFYSMERNIREKLDQMSEVEEHILAKVEKFDQLLEKKVSTIDENLEKLNRQFEGKPRLTLNSFVFQDINCHIELKNVSHEKEASMSGVLVQLFEEAVNENEDFKSKLPADSFVKLREVVNRTVQMFLSKGWQIVETKQKCVQLSIRCQSFAAFSGLCRECIEGSLEAELEELKSAISEISDGEKVELETVIYKDEFWNVIDKTLSALEIYRSENDENRVEYTEDVQKTDAAADVPHSVLISARKESAAKLLISNNGCEAEDLHTCLKSMEKEIANEFDAPDVFVKACFTERQVSVEEDSRTREVMFDSLSVPINQATLPDSPVSICT